MKRFASILLAALMMLSMVPLAAGAQELTVATWLMDPSFTTQNDPVYEMIKERFGISIKPVPITWEDYLEKIPTWLATGDAPDIFVFDGLDGDASMAKMVRSWAEEELIRAVPEDLSAYPHLQARFEDPVVQQLAYKGKQYWIPRYKGDTSGNPWACNMAAYYRKDWAKALGFESIDTYDQLVAFLRAVRDGDPTGTGAKNIVPMVADTYPLYAIRYLWHTFEPWNYDFWMYKDGMMQKGYMAEHAYDAASSIRGLFNEGLIDPDILINDGNEVAKDLFSTNQAAMICTQLFSNDAQLWAKYLANNPGITLEDTIGYLGFMPNVFDGVTYSYNFNVNYWSETFISSNVSDEKYEKILKFLDFTSSDEWFDIFFHGLEGVDYKVENGEIVYLTEDGNRPETTLKYPVLNGINELTVLFEGRKFAQYYTVYPYIGQMFNEYHDLCVDRTPIPVDDLTFMLTTSIDDWYVDNSTAYIENYIFGGSTGDPKEEWDAMIELLRSEGYEEMQKAMLEAVRESGRLD